MYVTDSFLPFSLLSMRFPECFVAADEARELQKHIQDEIAHYIVKRSRPPSLIHKLEDDDGVEVTQEKGRALSRRTSVRCVRKLKHSAHFVTCVHVHPS